MKNILSEKPTDELFGLKIESLRIVRTRDIVGKTVLDLGCGFGWGSYSFLKMGARKVVGVDISRDAEVATSVLNGRRFNYVKASATSLPFRRGVFDTVVSWEVLEHLPKGTEYKMLSEVYRVLKPGGVFVLSTPFESFLSNFLDPAWWLIGHRHYSRGRLVDLFSAAGFKVLKIYPKGGLYTSLFMLNLYIAKWVFRRPPFVERWFKARCSAEVGRERGFTNIFVRCAKPLCASERGHNKK